MNVLFLQLKRIGDLVLTTPAIAATRERFPEAQITLAVSAAGAALLPAIAGRVRPAVFRNAPSDVGAWMQIARGGFDYCVDFTRNDRSACLAFLSRARKRITSDRIKVRAPFRASVYNECVAASVRESHTADYHLALLRPLGIEHAASALQLQVPASAQSSLLTVLAKFGIDGPFALLHPGSARREKFWLPERWGRVAEACASQGLACVVTGSASPLEREHIAEIRAHTGVPFTDLSGELDLCTLLALIAQARLLVTVDSAPMHLAAAMKTPQVVLFGPTNPFHWRPRDTPAAILLAGQDLPLTEFSPEMQGGAMNQISTERVIDAMKSLLSAPAASAHEPT